MFSDKKEDKKGKNEEKNSSDMVMNMMKEMYQNGDDKTKQMIAETWQKSQDEKKSGKPSLQSKINSMR